MMTNVQCSISNFPLWFCFRATENKMTAYNLSLIFAPNLFPFDTDSKSIESHDKLEVAVMYTFIENANHIGKAFSFLTLSYFIFG